MSDSTANHRTRHTISALVNDETGVLTRIAAMFSRRGYNIESLAVGACEQPGCSRMTIVALADEQEIIQIRKQLEKLICVLQVQVLDEIPFVDRELVLYQVAASANTRVEITQLVELFRGRIVDVASESLIIEVTGDQGKLKAFEQLVHKFGLLAIGRSGKLALPRGTKDESQQDN